MGLGFLMLLMRMVYLHLMHNDFLQSQGDARLVRVVDIPAHRGVIFDRHGALLALSTPVDSVWVNPQTLDINPQQLQMLSQTLGLSPAVVQAKIENRQQQKFVYLKRHISPHVTTGLKAKNIIGLHFLREYKRYYPAAATTAHVIGFTDIDDVGLEGLELKFNLELRGIAGKKQVIQDRQGRIIAAVADINAPKQGQDLRVTLDKHLSDVLHHHLQQAVIEYRAKSAMAVLVDNRSGEILAMVNQPSYNPNNRAERVSNRYRNRVVTDVFEPGSTMKPFAIAAGLESGLFTPTTRIDTTPGELTINHFTIRDSRDHGHIDVATVLQKSSNVGASKIALSLSAQQYGSILSALGFGQVTSHELIGEVAGDLEPYRRWQPVKQASLAFGYGMNTTLLQLAQAYTVLANDGVLQPLHVVKKNHLPPAKRILQAQTARQIRQMLQRVTEEGGTAVQAHIPRYPVAGKTGTVHKAISGGYAQNRYKALFVGMLPADNPRLVLALVFDEPEQGNHYGGEVAAPVFAQIMLDVLHTVDVPPSY